MLETALSLLLSLGFAYHGRDKVWTPTFKGSRVQRFQQAVAHYQDKMALDSEPLIMIHEGLLVVYGERRCAAANRDAQWSQDNVHMSLDPQCNVHKPEALALHEQCHRRMMHLESSRWSLPRNEKEREVKTCMAAYSKKERR
jgi:hypothetical protein